MMQPYPLTLLFDGACPLCRLEMDNLKARNTGGRLNFVDISAPGFDPAPYKATVAEMQALIHAVTADGRLVRGVEVFRLAYAAIGLGWITSPTGWPLLKPLFDRAYVQLARHRYLVSEKLAWLVFGLAARRAERRSRACREAHCER